MLDPQTAKMSKSDQEVFARETFEKAEIVKDFCNNSHHAWLVVADNYRLSDSSLFDVTGTRTLKCKYCGKTKKENYTE